MEFFLHFVKKLKISTDYFLDSFVYFGFCVENDEIFGLFFEYCVNTDAEKFESFMLYNIEFSVQLDKLCCFSIIHNFSKFKSSRILIRSYKTSTIPLYTCQMI